MLWVAHRRELVEQGDARLELFGVENRVVTSVQSLLAGDVPECDFAVIDEAHHIPKENSWSRVTQALRGRGVQTLGLTATPQRADGRGLGSTFDKLVVGATPSELIADGYLCNVDVFFAGARHANGIAMTPRAAWEQYADGRRTVVFCRTVAEAESERAAWGEGEVIHGKLGARERAQRLASPWQVLFNVYVLTEGWDLPEVKCAILARGCGSLGLYLQIAGRILRPHESYASAVLVDLVGSSADHGHPCETHDYSLDGAGIRAASSRSFATCIACGFMLPDSEPTCFRCGQMRETAKRRDAKKLFITNEKMLKLELAATAAHVTKVRQLADWVKLGKLRNYKPGFSAARFNQQYGAYPTRAERNEANDLLLQQ